MPSAELKLVPKLFSAELKLATSVAITKAKKKLQSRMMCKRGATGGVVDAEVERQRKRSACVASGAAQLAELFRLLDSFPGLTRSKVQKQLHLGMCGSILQRVFCNESDSEMKMAQVQYKIKSSKQQFMAITPRRFGKTTAVAMFCAAFALAVPGSVTAIFSTGRRASNLLLQQIKSMLVSIPGAEAKITSSNVETIHLCDGGLTAKISSFPGQART